MNGRGKTARRKLRAYRNAISKTSFALVCPLLLFAIFLVLLRPNERPEPLSSSDYWVHAVVLRNVTTVLESGSSLTALILFSYKHKTPYMLALALFSSAFGLSASTVLLLAAAFNVLLLAAGIALFVRRFVSRRAPVGLFLFTALFFWGPGFFHSNEYHLGVLPIAASFPSTFCFALSLIGLAVYGRLFSNGGRSRAAIYADLGLVALIGAAVLLNHPRTFFSFLLPTAGMAAVFLAKSRVGKALALAVPIPLFLLAALWPWFGELTGPMLELAKREMTTRVAIETPPESEDAGIVPLSDRADWSDGSDESDESKSQADVLLPSETGTILRNRSLKTYEKHYTFKRIKRYAPAALVGFPLVLLLFLRRNRKALFIAATALLCLALWAICGYVFHTALGYRWLYFYGFFMQIAAARLIWDLAAHKRLWALSVLVLVVVLSVGWDSARDAVRLHLGQPVCLLPYNELDRIASFTGRDPVLAGPRVSHYMGAFGIRPVWEGRVRQGAPPRPIAEWLANPAAETLLRAAERSGAKWFLSDKEEGSLGAPFQVGMPELVLETRRYALYRVPPPGKAGPAESFPR